MVPPVSDPHVQMALVSKDPDCPADWVLSLGLWILMGLTSKPMWNFSESLGSKSDRTMAYSIFFGHMIMDISKRAHNKAMWYKRNAHVCLQITRVSSFLLLASKTRSPAIFVTQKFVLFWRSVLRPRWVKGLWTAFMQFDGAGHVSCQFVSIICHMFSFRHQLILTNVEYTWRCLTLSKPVWWDFNNGQVRRMFSCKA